MSGIIIRRLRRAALLVAACGAVALAAAAPLRAATVRIGYQKYGQMILLKQRGTLETTLSRHGDTVEWKLFTAGPQMLEALGAGAIDMAITGETPPVFAQAAGTRLLYVGAEPASPAGEAILVPKASTLARVADLKGKRVALNRGSNVHWLLLRALQQAGLAWTDITPVYLPPPSARAAFASGALDGWAIWDPFMSSALAGTGARILTTGKGLVPNRQFYLARQIFAAEHPALLQAVLAEIRSMDDWARGHQDEVATLLAPGIGLDLPTTRKAVASLGFGMTPMTAGIIADQQTIADSFSKAGLIPEPIKVRDIVWQPAP